MGRLLMYELDGNDRPVQGMTRGDMSKVHVRELIHPRVVWIQYGFGLLSIVAVECRRFDMRQVTVRLVVHEADSTIGSVSFLFGLKVKQDPPMV